GLFPAPAPEFADRAVRVQHERRFLRAFELRGQFLEQLAHLALQRVELNLPGLKVGTADHDSSGRQRALDFPEQDAAIGQQQPGTYRRARFPDAPECPVGGTNQGPAPPNPPTTVDPSPAER